MAFLEWQEGWLPIRDEVDSSPIKPYDAFRRLEVSDEIADALDEAWSRLYQITNTIDELHEQAMEAIRNGKVS